MSEQNETFIQGQESPTSQEPTSFAPQESTNSASQEPGNPPAQGSDGEPAKKSRKGLKAAIIAIAAVAVLGTGIFLAFKYAGDYIVNRFMLLTKSEEEYYEWYVKKALIAKGYELTDYSADGRSDESSESKDGIGAGSFGTSAEAGTNAGGSSEETACSRMILSAELSEEFEDIARIPHFKPASLELTAAMGKDSIDLDTVAIYDGQELLNPKLSVNTSEKNILAMIPSYSDKILDLSELGESELEDGTVLWKLLEDILNDLHHYYSGRRTNEENVENAESITGENAELTTGDNAELITGDAGADSATTGGVQSFKIAVDVINYINYLIESEKTVVINKGLSDSIEDKQFDYYEVKVNYNTEQLLKLLTGLLQMASEDELLCSRLDEKLPVGELIEKNENLSALFDTNLKDMSFEQLFKQLYREVKALDASKLKKEHNISISFGYSLFVDDWGRMHGGKVEAVYNSTKLGMQIITDTEQKTLPDDKEQKNISADKEQKNLPAKQVKKHSATDIELSFTGIKAAEIKIRKDYDENEDYTGRIELEPGKLIKSFLGEDCFKIALDISKESGSEEGSTTYGYVLDLDVAKQLQHDYMRLDTDRFSISDYLISLEAVTKQDGIDLKAQLLKNGIPSISGEVQLSKAAYNGPFVRTEGREVCVYGTDTFPEYLDINDALKYLLRILAIADSEELNNRIEGIIEEKTGVSIDLDLLMDFYRKYGEKDVKSSVTSSSNYFYDLTADELISPERTFSYSCEVLKDYASGGDYENMKYDVGGIAGAKAAVEEAKRVFLENHSEQITVAVQPQASEIKEPSVQFGDTIVFDVVPYLGGIPMMTYAFTDLRAVVGEYEYGEGIDDAIVGMKCGESKDVVITLNNNYGSFSGYSGNFRITVKSIESGEAQEQPQEVEMTIVPEWTEEKIVGEYGYASLEACLDELIRATIPDRLPSFEEIGDELCERVGASFKFYDIPASLTDIAQNVCRFDTMLLSSGLAPELQYGLAGYSRENFETMFSSLAYDKSRQLCMFASIASAERITVNGAEVEACALKLMETCSVSNLDELLQIVPASYVIDRAIEEKIRRMIYDNLVFFYL